MPTILISPLRLPTFPRPKGKALRSKEFRQASTVKGIQLQQTKPQALIKYSADFWGLQQIPKAETTGLASIDKFVKPGQKMVADMCRSVWPLSPSTGAFLPRECALRAPRVSVSLRSLVGSAQRNLPLEWHHQVVCRRYNGRVRNRSNRVQAWAACIRHRRGEYALVASDRQHPTLKEDVPATWHASPSKVTTQIHI